MTKRCRIIAIVSALSAMVASSVYADDRVDGRDRGPIYSIAHFDVIPLTLGGVDFLQSAYSLLFTYRDQSKTEEIKPLLGSPFDHRLTILCGKTYSDSAGCTPP